VPGIKGNGLISEAGGIVTTSVKKGGKAAVREVTKFAETAREQITGGQKPLVVEPNGEKKKEQEEARIRQLQTNLRMIATWQQTERERIKRERERTARIQQEALVGQKREEKKRFPGWDALEWFKSVGKKARGWLFERKKTERIPAGFHG